MTTADSPTAPPALTRLLGALAASRLGRRIGLVLMAALLAVPATAEAQTVFRSTPALGLGGGGAAYVKEVNAMYVNPANIALSNQEGRTAISLFQVGDQFGGSAVKMGLYNDYFTGGRTLGDAEVETILDDWFGTGLKTIRNRADVLLGGFVVRGERTSYGGGVRLRSHVETKLNRGWADLLLRGTGSNRTIPLDGELRSFSSVDLSVSFARQQTDRLRVGITPKIVLGLDYARGTLDSEVQVSDDAVVHRFDYEMRSAGLTGDFRNQLRPFDEDAESPSVGAGVAGFGLGIDVGATYQLQEDLRLAASLRDLGGVNWSANAHTVTPEGEEFRFEGLEYDSKRIDEEFDGSFGDYAEHVIDSLAESAYQNTNKEEASFFSSLPTSFSAGADYSVSPKATVAGGFALGLTRTGGQVRVPSVYAGGEYRLGSARYHVPLRAGVRVGGARALGLSGGIGFSGPGYDFSISAMTSPSSDLLGSGSRLAVSVAVLTIRF